MNISEFLETATKRFAQTGIETARLDCLVMLEDVLKRDRASILAHLETSLQSSQKTILNKYVTQRIDHIPLAYIRGRVNFYGRKFAVNEHVLVPRPETEIMIDLLKKCGLPARPRITDIGTGSGCIGITAALEIPDSRVELYDIDTGALGVAKDNVRNYNLALTIKQSDLLTQVSPACDALLANLPYVPLNHPINKAAGHEPALALFGGGDGLDVYRRFFTQLARWSSLPTHLFTEALPAQHELLTGLAEKAGYQLGSVQGFIQHFTINP